MVRSRTETVTATAAHVKSGRLKALGVSFATGSAAMPGVAPLAEAADLPGFDIGGWIGCAAPPGTPRDIVARLSGEIQKAVQSSELKERFMPLGLDPLSSEPGDMAAFMQREQERCGSIIRNANIKIE